MQFEIAIYKVLHERNNITANFTEYQQLHEKMTFTQALWLNRDQSRKENYSQKTIHFQSVIWRVVDRRSNITASSVEHQKFQQKFTFTEAFRVNSRKSKQKNKNQGAIHFEIAIWKVIHKSCSNIASFSERLILREKIRLLKHFR